MDDDLYLWLLDDRLNTEPETVACDRCGATGLSWDWYGQWRLIENYGERHHCRVSIEEL